MFNFKTFLVSISLVFALSSMAVVFGQEQSQKSDKLSQEITNTKTEHCDKTSQKDSCCAMKKATAKKTSRNKIKKVAFTSCCSKGSACCDNGNQCCEAKSQVNKMNCCDDGSCCIDGAACCNNKSKTKI